MRGTTLGLRRTFIRGILLILPLAATWAILAWLFRLISGFSAPLVGRLLDGLGVPVARQTSLGYLMPVVGLLVTVAIVMLVGLIGGHYLGRTALAWFEQLLMKVPLVKWVYGAARQLMDAFSATGSGAFREVVFVEFPRRGVWTLGFVTAEAGDRVPAGAAADSVYVYLPTTPNPTSGYTVVLSRAEAVPAGMSVEEGLKLIVSGGFIAPGSRDRKTT